MSIVARGDLVTFAIITATALIAVSATNAANPPTVHVSLVDFTIGVSAEHADAGAVTFQVSNYTEEVVHELLVVRTDLPLRALPFNEQKNEVKENGLEVSGKIEDLYPGESSTLMLDLSPGSYILLCNKPGHFRAGMAHRFVVMKNEH